MAEPESGKVERARVMLAEAQELAEAAETLRKAAQTLMEMAVREEAEGRSGTVLELHPDSKGADDPA